MLQDNDRSMLLIMGSSLLYVIHCWFVFEVRTGPSPVSEDVSLTTGSRLPVSEDLIVL